MTISEKRYRAEMEVEKLKKTVAERDSYIKELELKMAELQAENSNLKQGGKKGAVGKTSPRIGEQMGSPT